MKATITIKQEVDILKMQVKAHVRYWEDTTVNGEEDTDGSLIPCREGELWCPLIDVNTGQILNWKKGKTAEVHYKVCDRCSFYLLGTDDFEYVKIEDEYVPEILCPADKGYGDYIIMNINEDGFIEDWDASELEELVAQEED